MKSLSVRHRRMILAVMFGLSIPLGIWIGRTLRGDSLLLLDGVISFLVSAVLGYLLSFIFMPLRPIKTTR